MLGMSSTSSTQPPPQNSATKATRTTANCYQCDQCDKSFSVPARLSRHYRVHTGERPFTCHFCHKSFSVKENLSVHVRIHTNDRPYACDICGRAFEHSGKLHRHVRIHTGERPHRCNACGKTFIQSGQLVIHRRTHTGEKPYQCKVCSKAFTCSKQLKVHMRTHTGEKPYKCNICNKSFGYNHVLKLHQVSHFGEKVFQCTLCKETFTSKKALEAHIRGHASPKQTPHMADAASRSSKRVPTVAGKSVDDEVDDVTARLVARHPSASVTSIDSGIGGSIVDSEDSDSGIVNADNVVQSRGSESHLFHPSVNENPSEHNRSVVTPVMMSLGRAECHQMESQRYPVSYQNHAGSSRSLEQRISMESISQRLPIKQEDCPIDLTVDQKQRISCIPLERLQENNREDNSIPKRTHYDGHCRLLPDLLVLHQPHPGQGSSYAGQAGSQRHEDVTAVTETESKLTSRKIYLQPRYPLERRFHLDEIRGARVEVPVKTEECLDFASSSEDVNPATTFRPNLTDSYHQSCLPPRKRKYAKSWM